MKLEITKLCADSLRAFTQNNYGIQLKSSHAHELVAAYFGYSSRASLLADKDCSMINLNEAEIIILNPPTLFVDERRKTLENLPPELPASNVLAQGVYAPIVAGKEFDGKIWPGFHEVALAFAENRAYENIRMMGMDPKELTWVIDVDIKTTELEVLMTVIFDYPAGAKKPVRHSKVQIRLPRVAGDIGYSEPEVMPTFYHGDMTDPDFRLKHGID
ncbi:hypothetical protein FHW88_002503 [Mucilaginibacter sp. SG538B]|uniref:hypothetical protein n=1 Tax=Mucilaginibacter sp. SG538B TaxID=2587021 RepID=UPI00159D18B1|nr:hypothetical protein [Mucilaginibacter sp. SG538B]NVM64175.1 hypothetical protein [Mucilaginibacter sp. SG538B]NVM64214.1 hypothetical protein [Mucilaginibacter sp. SG538B]